MRTVSRFNLQYTMQQSSSFNGVIKTSLIVIFIAAITAYVLVSRSQYRYMKLYEVIELYNIENNVSYTR